MTTCCFDSNERRLVTAANDGRVKIWNFNNGSLLREYAHSDEALEISQVIYLTDEKRKSDCVYAAGWNSKVYIWEDEDEVCSAALSDSEPAATASMPSRPSHDTLLMAELSEHSRVGKAHYMQGRIISA